MPYHRGYSQSNTSATNGAGTAYATAVSEFTPVFGKIRVARSLVFYVVFCICFFCPFVCFSFGHRVTLSAAKDLSLL